MATSTPTELSFDTFPPLFPRRFLPESPDLTDRDQLVALYQSLLDRPIDSQEDLEAFLLDCSELNKAAYQAHAILSIRMRCQTDDKSRAEALKRFTEVVEPAVWPLEIEIDRKILDARTRFPAADDRYAVYIRRATTDVEIFRTENVDLAKQDDLIGQDYFALCGKMTFEHDGEEYPLPEATKFIKDPDRSLREKIWRAVAGRYLRDREAFEEIFDQLVKLRHTIAKNADFPDYLAYTFEAKHRYDYTPADCEAFHDAVESCIVPAANEIYERRRDALGLDTLRPWDLSVDPLGREALKPADSVPELIAGCRRAFDALDPELGAVFASMDDDGLLDLASRKGKAPGGFMCPLVDSGKIFIFGNASCIDNDLHLILHEAGHAFHTHATRDKNRFEYPWYPAEFAEVASMAMEELANPHLSIFYNEDEWKRSRRDHLEDTIVMMGWIATIDAFQHWLYTHPEHNPDERRDAWLETHNRFRSPLVDWTGLDQEQAYQWHKQFHVFCNPFYYIEYGIAQLGALQLWNNAKQDTPKALAHYKQALALGGSKPLPKLFEAAGITFDFSRKTLAPLIESIQEELASL